MIARRIVGLVGLVAAGALLVHRCDDAPTTRAAGPVSASPQGADVEHAPQGSPRARSTVVPRVGREPAQAAPSRTFRLRTDPGEPDDIKLIREETWSSLTTFAQDAALTEAQFQHLLGDLADLAALQAAASNAGMKGLSAEERHAFWEDQGTELHDRAAAYLTEDQMVILRGRFAAFGLVAQVRFLGLLEEAPTGNRR